MLYNDKTYIILPIEDIIQDMIDECIQTSIDFLRKNLSETHAILKWFEHDEVPTTIAALDPAPTQYTNAEIKAIIIDPENGWIETE